MTEIDTPRLPPLHNLVGLHFSLRAFALALIAAELALSAMAISGMPVRPTAVRVLALHPDLHNLQGLVTHAVLHVGPWHVMANLVPLVLFGDATSVRWGVWPMWAILTTATIAGGFTFLAIGPDAVLSGASGAAYGITGAAVVLWRWMPWIYRLVLVAMAATIPWHALAGIPVAWEAHAGGMISGVVLGLLLERRTAPASGG